MVFNKALSRAEEIRLSVLRGNLGRVAGLETTEQGSRNQEVLRQAGMSPNWPQMDLVLLGLLGLSPWPRTPHCTVPGASIKLGCKKSFFPLGQA